MSVKKHYTTVTHEVTEAICIGETIYCDICKKEIDDNKGYWHLTTGHERWGRDSEDSIEEYDVCSQMCLMNKFAEYLDTSDSDRGDTEYFNVERV